jgi:hypothetical protein
MVKYQLPHEYRCWRCKEVLRPEADVHARLVECRCECGASNPIVVDHIHFRIGSRMFYAALHLMKQGDHDVASVLLVTAIDATLGNCIVELTNWRQTQQGCPPIRSEDIEAHLKKWGWKKKVKEFEELAGATVQEEIDRLRAAGTIAASIDLSDLKIRDGFESVTTERNRLVHLGRPVKPEIIEKNLTMIGWAIIVLESLYFAAFDVRASSRGIRS